MFKVGDKVVALDSYGLLKKGKVYTVKAIFKDKQLNKYYIDVDYHKVYFNIYSGLCHYTLPGRNINRFKLHMRLLKS